MGTDPGRQPENTCESFQAVKTLRHGPILLFQIIFSIESGTFAMVEPSIRVWDDC